MVNLQELHGTGGGSSKQMARPVGPPTQAERDMLKKVNALVQGSGQGEVKAFVLVALRPENDVTVVTSRELQKTVQPVMQDWGDKHVPLAYEFSAFEGSDGVDEGILIANTSNDTDTFRQRLDSMPYAQLQEQPQLPHQPDLASLAAQGPRGWDVPAAFQIDDELSVTKTLLSCLHYLQQQTLKRVAKTWIRGICPQKQAKYPYRSRDRENRGRAVNIPPWWPSEHVCIFREPDHVERAQRLAILVHLLRLRPTIEQLRAWNTANTKKQRPIKTHQEHEWTAFLMDLAPLSVVDEVGPTDPEKSERRKSVLRKMYEIASLEEQYKDDAVDGNTMVQPLDRELQKTIVRKHGNKRTRQGSEDSSTADDSKSESVDSPAEASAKKCRRISGPKPNARRVPAKAKRVRKILTDAASSAAVNGMSDRTFGCKPALQGEKQTGPMIPYNGMMDSATPTPLSTSFGSTMSDVSSCDTMPFTPVSPFSEVGMGYRGHGQMPNGIQCHQAYSIPQPQFDTTPDTPTFGPGDFSPFDQQQPGLGHDMATLSLDRRAAGPQHMVQQPVHGLPSAHPVSSQHGQWKGMQTPQPFSYDIQQGMPSFHAQHAGLAIGGSPSIQGRSGWATNFNARPNFHGNNDMAYINLAYGANHELPSATPATLPASVVRGFTGHASGVGDSACPPGSYFPFHY